jgi:alkanesulfonate monooxygenase SsuD/methylene tetrahydromethanopterin reductase-like flavin-dependent oxidoreductase (luciferase family)
MEQLDYPAVIDYVRLVKQLWRGEVVDYDGPAGLYQGLKIDDLPDGPIPRTTMFHFGGPRASRAAADPAFDAVGFSPMLKPEVMYNSIQLTRREAERIGRDPDEIHFIAPVASAPELDEDEVRLLIAARIVIYLQVPELGATFLRMNGWDPRTRDEICNHPLFASMKSKLADNSYHRSELLEVTRLVPESWIREVAVVGSLEECMKMVQTFKDTGCAEIDFYSSSPAQNASLIGAWRARGAR